MIKDCKICGVTDSKTLNYIINHPFPPKYIGFICNYKKSPRYLKFDKLKKLINVNKKKSKFVAVLVNPDRKILEKIQHLKFDYYQIYDCSPDEIKYIKERYKKKIISAFTIKNDQARVMTPKDAFKNKVSGGVMGRSLTKGSIKHNVKKVIDQLNQ